MQALNPTLFVDQFQWHILSFFLLVASCKVYVQEIQMVLFFFCIQITEDKKGELRVVAEKKMCFV